MHIKSFTVVYFLLVISCLLVNASAASTLSLSWYKNNGFGMGTDINGEWTVTAEGIQNTTTHVEFYLDNQLQQNDTLAPFSWHFNTANFTEGTHSIKAITYDSDGQSATAVAERNFVGFPVSSVAGIIVLIVVVLVVSLIVTWFWIKKKARTYKKSQ
jgi:hypothetical protein